MNKGRKAGYHGMEKFLLKEKLLALLEENEHGMDPYQAAERLGISKQSEEFLLLARQMIQDGQILLSKKGKLMSPLTCGFLKGKVISQSAHFCFVRPVDGGEDIYIDKRYQGEGMLGDTVLLAHVEDTSRGRSARITQVLERDTRLFTGTVHREGRDFILEPDAAFRFNIPILSVPGDKKKRKASPEIQLRDGKKILAEIFPDPQKGKYFALPRKEYGVSSNAKVCADAILDAHGIPVPFSPQTMKEASFHRKTPLAAEEIARRLDLRQEVIFTIDGADAKDLDDAVSITQTETGWKLGVHIADVSHYVRPGSSLDQEAWERGTSVYFADRVVPMYPTDISNHVCSLNAHEDKLTLSALITFDRAGTMTEYSFRKTVIRSKVRGVYAEVNAIFDGSASPDIVEKYAPVASSLFAARELATVLKKKSIQRGTVDLESKETRFTLDEKGVCVALAPRTTGEAEGLIEQLMIAANQAAARLAREESLPFVYRVHEDPAPERIENLLHLTSLWGFRLSHSPRQPWRTADFASLMEQAKDTPYSSLLSHQLLRTMAKAKYDPRPLGHFGLALEDYCHFTSPIRRYPDTCVHRILSDYLAGASSGELKKRYADFSADAARQSFECELRAMTAERSAERCYMAEYARAHLGEVAAGRVSGVTEWGIYVELENTLEGFISGESLPRRYRFDGTLSWKKMGTKDAITIGDPLTIQIGSADVSSGRIDFLLSR